MKWDAKGNHSEIHEREIGLQEGYINNKGGKIWVHSTWDFMTAILHFLFVPKSSHTPNQTDELKEFGKIWELSTFLSVLLYEERIIMDHIGPFLQ